LTRVLVVDDSKVVFKMIKNALEPKGFIIVDHAENGRLGLEKYKQHKPDVITLDITMPAMDGLEMAKELLAIEPGAKIVMLSAMGDQDLMDQAREIGVNYFATKPVDAVKLVEIINECLGGG
jgi:two-component system chemotaxis response regulator CheY